MENTFEKLRKFIRIKKIEKLRSLKKLKIEKEAAPQTIRKGNLYAMLDADRDLIKEPSDLHELILLYQYLPVIFPSDSVILWKIIDNERVRNATSNEAKAPVVNFLAYRITSNEWLVNYIQKVLQTRVPQENIKTSVIKRFVEQSVNFAAARDDFKQRYIRVNITKQMKYGKVKNRLPLDHGYFYFAKYDDCDKIFREHLRCSMMMRGLDYQSVQLGIEANADLWRDQVMNQAFENKFNQYLAMIGAENLGKRKIDSKIFKTLKAVYQKNWKKIRMYDYYQFHHEFIDKLGLATSDMKLSPKKIERIKQQNANLRNLLGFVVSQADYAKEVKAQKQAQSDYVK
ncbi:MAG: hypothetical protein IKT33_00240 [Clostridia bacterium]|nr:hypothetical protein [Clostridia bacterium]